MEAIRRPVTSWPDLVEPFQYVIQTDAKARVAN